MIETLTELWRVVFSVSICIFNEAQNMKTRIPPIACSLSGEYYKKRLAWIAELTRDSLQTASRHGLVLDLAYAISAADRVRDMVRKEKACCAFLTFELRENDREIRLRITAPEAARENADALFQQFL